MKMNRFWKNLIVAIVAVSVTMPVAFAKLVPVDKDKGDQDPNVKGGLSVSKCFEKGGLDFALFLNTFIFNDGFKEGLIEPWKDILVRNQCHATAVSGLINQQDKVRKTIRDAFLTCKTEKLPAYKRAFNELNAEIYYVRHVVDGDVVISLPYDLLSTRMLEDEGEIYYPQEKLYSEMKTRYVDSGDFEIEEFDILFADLVDKYADLKKTYVLCENGSWKVVEEKFNEFLESFEEMGDDFKNDIKGQAEKVKEAVGLEGGFPIEAFNQKSVPGFLGSFTQTNFNKQNAKMSLSELQENNTEYSDFMKTLQEYGIGKKEEDEKEDSEPSVPVTVDALLDRNMIENKRFDTETLRNEMSSIIEANYGNVSDQVTSAYVFELNKLNATIKDAYPHLDAIKECAKTMNDKQCVQ